MQTLWEISCGLGLCLVGLRIAADGATLALGRAHQAWVGGARSRGLRAGLAFAAVAPGHGRASRAGLGLAAVLPPVEALWAACGAASGGVLLLALAAVTVLAGALVQALCVLLLLGGAIAWSALPGARHAALGRLACGWGALLAALALLHSGFGGLTGRVALDSVNVALVGLVAGGIVLGCAGAVLMRSPAPVLLFATFAAAGRTIELVTAGALVIGAHLGAGIEAAFAVRDGAPCTRRAAVGQLAFLGLGGVVGLMLLVGVQTFLGRMSQPAFATLFLFLFHAAFVALSFVPLWAHAPFTVDLLARRFRDEEQDETRPRHVDATTLDLPDLALAGLASELERVAQHALGFATIVLSEERATSFRTRLSLGVVERLGCAVEEHATLLTRAELPDHVARVLCDVPRATQAYRELVEWTNLVQTAPLEDELDARLRREIATLQHEVAGLLGHSDPCRLGCTLEEASALLRRVEARVRELERVLIAGDVEAEAAHACGERLHAVGRIGTLAVEAGHGLAGVFALCPRGARSVQPQPEEPRPELQEADKSGGADEPLENVA